MAVEFVTLLQRDHGDLQQELTRLLDPMITLGELRDALDGVRLGLTSHAEAEDIVLGRFEVVCELAPLVARAHAAHEAQHRALVALLTTLPGTTAWRDRACQLRELIARHAADEEATLIPALRRHVAAYALLAGAFASERLRQLAMQAPSAPIVTLAAAG